MNANITSSRDLSLPASVQLEQYYTFFKIILTA